MLKYHYNSKGKIQECRATLRRCTYARYDPQLTTPPEVAKKGKPPKGAKISYVKDNPNPEFKNIKKGIQNLADSGPTWDGMTTIPAMKKAGSSHYKQSEWAAFHVEEVLNQPVGGTYGNTTIDTIIGGVDYDIKTHTASVNGIPERSSIILLNDQEAMEASFAANKKFGLIVVSGDATVDDNAETFKRWHNTEIKHTEFVPRVEGARIRRLKTSFTLQTVTIYEFSEEDFANGDLFQPFIQGKNHEGSERRPKYKLCLKKAANNVVLQSNFVVK